MLKKVLNYLVMSIVWVPIVASLLFFFALDVLVWLLTFWWDKRLWLLHKYSGVWALFYIWVNPFWTIDIKGEENIKKGQAYIIVSNHQSAFDIVVLYRLWMHFKWVAKREIFQIPFIGWNLWLNNHIAIDRTSVRGARKMITQAQEHLKQGSSVLIFPEGTRSTDGVIKRFKDGAFVLAKKTGYPILPVVIEGTLEVFPKNGFVIKGKQKFVMRILPEITADEYLSLEVDELTTHVQHYVADFHRQIAPNRYQGKG